MDFQQKDMVSAIIPFLVSSLSFAPFADSGEAFEDATVELSFCGEAFGSPGVPRLTFFNKLEKEDFLVSSARAFFATGEEVDCELLSSLFGDCLASIETLSWSFRMER
jgi:hypothetical protein